jgi:hypothetical protein
MRTPELRGVRSTLLHVAPAIVIIVSNDEHASSLTFSISSVKKRGEEEEQ